MHWTTIGNEKEHQPGYRNAWNTSTRHCFLWPGHWNLLSPCIVTPCLQWLWVIFAVFWKIAVFWKLRPFFWNFLFFSWKIVSFYRDAVENSTVSGFFPSWKWSQCPRAMGKSQFSGSFFFFGGYSPAFFYGNEGSTVPQFSRQWREYSPAIIFQVKSSETNRFGYCW